MKGNLQIAHQLSEVALNIHMFFGQLPLIF